jgi:hypothetical protein
MLVEMKNTNRGVYASLPTNSLTNVLLQVNLRYTKPSYDKNTNKQTSARQDAYATGLCVSTAFSQPDTRSSIGLRVRKMTGVSYKGNYSRVSFCDGSFYDDLHLQPLSSRIEHSRLIAHHCRNSIVLSLLRALLALFRCACVSSFSILVQFF